MRKLVVPKFLVLSVFFSIPCFAFEPPPGLCALLVARGVAPALFQAYFAPAAGHVYESLSPELRRKLVQASVSMMSLPSENPRKRAFAGENWGVTAISHLWLLGQSQEQILGHVTPLLEETYATRVAPGLALFERGSDFRMPVEPIPAMTGPAGGGLQVITIFNGVFQGKASDLSNAILRARDRNQIDSEHAETVPGKVKDYFDGALLAGNNEMAEKFLRYMIYLDKGDSATLYALEDLGKQPELLEVGRLLALESIELMQARDFSFVLRNKLASAVEALSRVTAPHLKPRANEMLLDIAQLIWRDDFFEPFEPLSPTDLIDEKYAYYDIALRALQAMGRITARHYADSVRIELTQELPSDALKAKALIRWICDAYMRLDYRMHHTQFHEVRRALLAIGDKGRLRIYGESLFKRRAQWADDWFPANVYTSAFEFLMAADDVERARAVLDAEMNEFTFAEATSREDRRLLSANEVEQELLPRAVRAGHQNALLRLSEICEEFEWDVVNEKIAAALAGEIEQDSTQRFSHTPEIPNGIGSALGDAIQAQIALTRHAPEPNATRAALLAKAGSDLGAGDLEAAYEGFRRARSAQGMIAVGDAFLALHYKQTSARGRHLGASAHAAYVLAAIFERQER